MSGPSRVLPAIGELVGAHFGRPLAEKKKRPKGPNGENATELLFCSQRIDPLKVSGRVYGYQFIGNKRSHGLKITARRRYTPDYRIDLAHWDGIKIYVECKGKYFTNPKCEKLYQAAKIRLDVAAEKYAAVFILAVKEGRGWAVSRVPGLGDSIQVPAAVLKGLGCDA